MPLSPKWFFQLDELDVLEFAYQAVADARHPKKECRAMEDAVLKEQEVIEEQAEQALEAILGDAPLGGECPMHHHHDDDDFSVDELLEMSAVGSNALAARAYRFFREVMAWAADADDGVCYQDLFRLKATAPLVPAKIAFASIELEHGDAASVLIAEKELDVAGIYLSQMIASCEMLRREEALNAQLAAAFLGEGEQLLAAVLAERDRLRARMKFPGL